MGGVNWQTAGDLFGPWKNDLLSGTPPTLYRCGEGPIGDIQLGPGIVSLLGGPPGAGKTAFTMQLAVDGLRMNQDLRVLVANVEVTPQVLLDRQVSRLAGLEYDLVRACQVEELDPARLEVGLAALESISDRLAFVSPPFDLEHIAAAADEHEAGLLVLDYVQRIRPPGEAGDKRNAIDNLMSILRLFADEGVGVIAVSSAGRQRDDRGRSTYSADVLGLASFRESSELKFGADDAYMLGQTDDSGRACLKHLKARHSERQNIELEFLGRYQQFREFNSAAAFYGISTESGSSAAASATERSA